MRNSVSDTVTLVDGQSIPTTQADGHGTATQEMVRGFKALACIQHTPTTGRLFTVTDPNDPLLEEWVTHKERVSFITRKEPGGPPRVKTVPAHAAKGMLVRATQEAVRKAAEAAASAQKESDK